MYLGERVPSIYATLYMVKIMSLILFAIRFPAIETDFSLQTVVELTQAVATHRNMQMCHAQYGIPWKKCNGMNTQKQIESASA